MKEKKGKIKDRYGILGPGLMLNCFMHGPYKSPKGCPKCIAAEKHNRPLYFPPRKEHT